MGDDPIGILVALFSLIFLLSVLPLAIIQNNVDSQVEMAIEEAVEDFTDNVRSTGYITKEEYEIFKNELTTYGYTLNVEMLHRSKVVVPNGSSYSTAYNAYNFNDILDALETNGIYTMKNGDFFYIKLTSVDSTFGSKIFSTILGTSGTKIAIPSGGMVGNTY